VKEEAVGMRGAARALSTAAALAVMAVAALTGCTAGPAPTAAASTSPAPPEASTPPASQAPAVTPTPTPAADPGPLVPSGDPTAVVSGLESPWSIAQLADGSMLISERDSGEIVEVVGSGTAPVGTVSGVVHAGEGGLLGLAPLETSAGSYLYAYLTTADDNRVVRMPLGGTPGAHTIGDPEVLLSGIPKASNHDGGRIAFGPDGMLYVTAGDASITGNAQDPASLGGKILRITPTGGIPADNPFPGSPVWTLGHRNPQGIAWAADGTMWAAEFGQDTWDEINKIVPGSNYGWPVVEGLANDPRFVDPIVQWSTDTASPSAIAIIGDTIFMAGLGGERLWTITFDGRATEWYDGRFGRIRDVAKGPGSTLYFLTNNTDGRGTPRPGDDVLYQVALVPQT
jgi:glucose/arabinose dehydrogenase